MRPTSTIRPITRISVVDDDPAMRALLARLSETAGQAKCAGQFADAEAALAKVLGSEPDAVFMDVRLPGENGLQCARKLRRLIPRLRIIIVTGFPDRETLLQTEALGASGFILKPFTPEEIAKALQVAAEGGFYSNANLEHLLNAHPRRSDTTSGNAALALLSERELEIVELLAEGFQYKGIADRLEVSVRTIDNHLRNIRDKLSVHNVAGILHRFYGGG